MLRSYPLTRCPACKKAFRQEVKNPASMERVLGLSVCPHCGLRFNRFELPTAKVSVGRVSAR